MTMSISVALLSGRVADIEVEEGSSLEEVQRRAQQMLGVRGRLMASDGAPLKGTGTVLQAGVSDGDSLTLLVPSLRILAGSSFGFAGVLSDDSLVFWGEELPQGTPWGRKVKNVQQVAATSEAFAALLWDGSVVTWGSQTCGGDSSAVKEELRNVQKYHRYQVPFRGLPPRWSLKPWSLCCHPRRWGRGNLRQPRKWQRQQLCPTSTERREAHCHHSSVLCSASARWFSGRLGESFSWW